jgi:hypothetical protein
LPGPALTTKKVMLGACGGAGCAHTLEPSDISAADANRDNRIVVFIVVLPVIETRYCAKQ